MPKSTTKPSTKPAAKSSATTVSPSVASKATSRKDAATARKRVAARKPQVGTPVPKDLVEQSCEFVGLMGLPFPQDDVAEEDSAPVAAPVSKAVSKPARRSAPALSDSELAARTKLKEEMLAVFKDSLRIEVEGSDGGFTDPNGRVIKVFFAGTCVARASFDVREKEEYGG